ncbi:MAG: hypothetical protein CMJ46_16630 [Planctomyces sp.]|nr:hypothetical protein [Planctomyces sp.]
MEYLARMPNLIILTLSNTAVDDSAVATLKQCKQLEQLVLTKTNISRDQGEELRAALPHLKYFHLP